MIAATRSTMRRRCCWAAAALCTLMCAAAGQGHAAVPVSRGGSVALSGTTVAARPELAGTVIADALRPFTIRNEFGAVIASGTFQDRVVRRNGTGTLEFSFRLINSPNSRASIVYVNRVGYAPFASVDVDYALDGLGTVGAAKVSRNAPPFGNNGGDMTFDFSARPVAPGEQSRFHFIGTSATEYAGTGFVGISAFAAGRSFVARPTTFQPAAPNLRVRLSAPATARPGEDIGPRIRVYGGNVGDAPAPGTSGTLDPANGYMIDLVLSTDRDVPTGFATYAPGFAEDVLLRGGRISNTFDLSPRTRRLYPVGARIPDDTPPGNYYLCVRIDPANRVAESNEADNVWCVRIRVVAAR